MLAPKSGIDEGWLIQYRFVSLGHNIAFFPNVLSNETDAFNAYLFVPVWWTIVQLQVWTSNSHVMCRFILFHIKYSSTAENIWSINLFHLPIPNIEATSKLTNCFKCTLGINTLALYFSAASIARSWFFAYRNFLDRRYRPFFWRFPKAPRCDPIGGEWHKGHTWILQDVLNKQYSTILCIFVNVMQTTCS